MTELMVNYSMEGTPDSINLRSVSVKVLE